MNTVVCDFCSEDRERIRWQFQCTNILAATTIQESGITDHWHTGPWAACDECADLVEANDWNTIIDRSFATGVRRNLAGSGVLPDEMARQLIGNSLQGFRDHRRGEGRVPFESA
jgi:hypothetical protein